MGFEVIQGDALIELPKLAARGVVFDACITDPPYGTTACAWDAVIPFEPMWANLKQVVKPSGAIILFGSQPFTSALVMSNPGMFRYEIIWDKVNRFTGFLDANRKPLKCHENMLLFSQDLSTYNPQMGIGKPYTSTQKGLTSAYGSYRKFGTVNEGTRYPTSIHPEKADLKDNVHTSQKPVELMRYLVRTYTNPGETVLDFTMGSGSTGVACIIEGRNFIGIEQSADYCAIGEARMRRASGEACDIPRLIRSEKILPLFAGAVA